MNLNCSIIKKTMIFLTFVFLLLLGFNVPAIADENVNPVEEATAASIQPTDIKGNWAAAQINDWLGKGLVKGYQDNTFRPDQQVSRAEFMTMVNRAFGFTASSPTKYSDVAAGDWFAAEIGKAQAAGYISGYEDGTIRPNAAVRRQEAASMLNSIKKLQSPTDATSLSKFKDSTDIPEWSKAAIAAVVSQEFMNGYPDQTFQPYRNISRAEAVVTLNNAISTPPAAATSAKIFDKAGVYGNESNTETINGDVTIGVAGVTLQNMKISGNLILTEAIGDGDVTLKKVIVTGNSIIKGGGANSVKLEDCTLATITVNKDNVRVVASGTTSVAAVQLESGATLVKTESTGKGFEKVTISELIPAGANVTLSGNFSSVNMDAPKVNLSVTAGTIGKMEVAGKAAGANINLAVEAKVVSITLNAAITVSGQGSIESAKVNVAGTSMAQIPGTVENPNNYGFSSGITSLNNSLGTGSGTGSGGGGGVAPLNLVSSDPADGSTGVSTTPTIKMTFDRGVVRDHWDNNQNCFSMQDSSGQSVAITVSRASNYLDDSEKENIYITPDSSLTAGSTYTLTVSASLQANNDNTLGTAQSISFTIAGNSSGGGGDSGGSSARILTISDGDGKANSNGLNAPAPNGPADGAQTTRTIMTFKLSANAVENIIIPTGNNISIAVSNISGLTQGDLTNIQLYTDPNGDGKVSDGAAIAAGTMGTVNSGNATISFNVSTEQTVAASVYMNYIVRLDTTANWGDGDTFSFASNSISIMAQGASSQQAAAIAGSITACNFVNPAATGGAPAFVSASVTTDGSVSVTFSKEMENNPITGKEGQFTVKVNNVKVNATGVERANTATKLKISLQTAITAGQSVTVKYDKDADSNKWITAADGEVLESFAFQTVSNTL